MRDTQPADTQQSFAALIQDDYDYKRPQRGQVLEAVILSIGENDMIVDLGGKWDGIVPPKDLEMLDEAYRTRLQIGDHVPVVVIGTGDRGEAITVSLKKGLEQEDWLKAQDSLDNGKVVESPVFDFNQGGVLVTFGRLQGFVPNSHLSSLPPGARGTRLQEAKENLVGEVLPLIVIEVNQRRRRLILSERAARRQQRQQIIKDLSEGDIVTGTVCNLVDFGAFVDMGGFVGLIHISELDWTHVNHPSDVLSLGDEVKVYVLNVDQEQKRIGLSRKRLLPDPWHKVTESLQTEETIPGTVTNVVSFGAFVDVGEGVEGLVHISEMPDGDTTRQTLEPGHQVMVTVLEIDHRQRQIALRLNTTTEEDN